MELRLGFRISLVLVILALTLLGEKVEAQRAGESVKIKYSDITPVKELILTVCD